MQEKSNSYVSQFVKPNEIPLNGLTRVSEQISLERRSWEQAGAAEQLAVLTLDFYRKWGMISQNSRPDALQVISTTYRAEMFGEYDPGKVGSYSSSKYLSHLPKKALCEASSLMDVQDSHSLAYRETIKPLVEERREVFEELLEKWKGYITGDMKHFSNFSQFLTAEAFSELRKPHRAFLVLLEQQRKRDQKKGPVDLIESTKRKATEDFAKSPSQESVATFVSQLEVRTNKTKKGGNELLSWLQFASFPSAQIDTERITTIVRSGQFPGSFRTAFVGFMDDFLTADASLARTALSQYKPDQVPIFSLNLKESFTKKRNGNFTTTHVETHSTAEEGPVISYILEAGDKISPNPLEVANFVKKQAKETRTNPQLFEDLAKMVAAISEDPYIIGVRRLSETKFLYFSAHENPTFKTTDPRTNRYRLVFDIVDHPRDGPNVRRVVIQDLLPHDEFDKKY